MHEICALVVLMVLGMAMAQAEDYPRWVKKGVAYLNKERSNDSYQFVDFHTHDVDLNLLQDRALKPLLKYVEENYGASYGSCETSPTSIEGYDAIKIAYTTDKGVKQTVYAVKIDSYERYDDFEENEYEWDYYQLYALSYPGRQPAFDNIKVTDQNNATAVALSIIPGMGQLYKGQKAKGWIILGGECFFVASAIAFECKRSYCHRQIGKHPEVADSWRSKTKGWRDFRNISIGCAAALYLYNLIDAGVSKGGRTISVEPCTINRDPALACVIRF